MSSTTEPCGCVTDDALGITTAYCLAHDKRPAAVKLAQVFSQIALDLDECGNAIAREQPAAAAVCLKLVARRFVEAGKAVLGDRHP